MISACIICAHAPDSGLSGLSARPAPEKICALTFDDGPDATMTPLILDKLDKHGTVATFFMIGQLITDDAGQVITRAVRSGCEIQNHSWGWESMSAMSAAEIRESVGKTTEAIRVYAGKAPSFFRPPNLSVSDTMYETIDLAFVSGVVGYDWAGCDTSAEDRAKHVIGSVRNGAIIVLHDVQPSPHPTPEALDIIIPELKKKGYRFVTVSELFRISGIRPHPHEKKLWVIAE